MTQDLSRLGGSLVAIVTPFRDTQLDEAALAALCRRQIDAGTGALVVCGSTGEASCLNTAEYRRAVRATVEAVAGRDCGM